MEAHPEQAIDIARSAATDLLEAIEEGRQQTDRWRNMPLAEAWVDSAMSQCLARLAETGLLGRANQLPSDAFWKIAGSVLSVGRLQHRARDKPLGYAGDHQMLSWIFDETVCDDPLGRHFDRFFLKQAAPASVRNRTEQVAGALAQHCLSSNRSPYRVVSIGAGPGIDIQRAVRMISPARREKLEVVLLDLDEKGLEFAQTRISNALPAQQITCRRENLFRLPKRSQAMPHHGETDFLICTGLFDYLEDASAATMLQLFWQQLAPGGTMVVGNFAPHCSTRAYMEWIGNWYLIYRTPAELAALAAAAELPTGTWSIGAERSGTNLFLTARKS